MSKSPNQIPFSLAPITLLVGHYGVGKTNLALNLILDIAKEKTRSSLVDLDIVNPYFRSSDYRGVLEDGGVDLISPVFAGSSLDVPSLSGAIYPVIESADENHQVIVDVGGDDVGATALGRFVETIEKHPYQMMYVINAYRNLTQTVDEAAQMLREIEARTGLKATGIINNSHLKEETTVETIEKSFKFAQEVCKTLDLPLAATTVPATIFIPGDDSCLEGTNIQPKSSTFLSSPALQKPYVVQVYVRTPWGL